MQESRSFSSKVSSVYQRSRPYQSKHFKICIFCAKHSHSNSNQCRTKDTVKCDHCQKNHLTELHLDPSKAFVTLQINSNEQINWQITVNESFVIGIINTGIINARITNPLIANTSITSWDDVSSHRETIRHAWLSPRSSGFIKFEKFINNPKIYEEKILQINKPKHRKKNL